MMVVLVSTREEGLTIFPTHRIARSIGDVKGEEVERPGDELPGVVLYRGNGRYERIDDVFAYARRGEVLPQKTTYFFPKLTSGLLLCPLD